MENRKLYQSLVFILKLHLYKKSKKVTKSIIGMPIGFDSQASYEGDPYYGEENPSTVAKES